MNNYKKKIICKLISNNGESITEALVTFFISTVAIMVIATSIIASQKIIRASSENSNKIHMDVAVAEEFLAGGNQDYKKDTISISTDGYFYSEDEIEFIETDNKKIIAFRQIN